jgi:uncharacterized protein YqjF (DUF2071 family)
MQKFLIRTSRTPRLLPPGRWQRSQRWNDLLLAHWPVPASSLAPLVPAELQVDTFQGTAWLGVMPFWIDRIKVRGVPPLPGTGGFPDLGLLTYVREEQTGAQGVYCLSLDASNLLAVAAGRAFFHLPYHWADMRMEQRGEREFSFYSRRRFTARPVVFRARYRGLGPTVKLAENRLGTLEYFLMERDCLFTSNREGQPIRANLRQVSSPLEEAEAEIERNDLASALGIELPGQDPVLHYSRRLAVYVWPAERVRSVLVPRPVPAALTPWG